MDEAGVEVTMTEEAKVEVMFQAAMEELRGVEVMAWMLHARGLENHCRSPWMMPCCRLWV